MKTCASTGMTLVEVLVAMTIASIVGAMLLQLVLSFQSRVLTEIRRNDLQDRAERLMRFLASDIRDAAFLLGPLPRVADDTPLALVHDSASGDPLQLFATAILAEDSSDGNDRLMLVKAVPFTPPLCLAQPGVAGESSVILNRRPNRSPGSTRELLPAPEAISHLVLANHQHCYAVQHAEQTLLLQQPLIKAVPATTEVLGVRASLYLLEPFSGSHRLRRDNFTSRDILDQAIDGLQFEYLLGDGSLVNQPVSPRQVLGVKISLLVRGRRPDHRYINNVVYTFGNRSYGPFGDHYRRTLVSRLVEVKNNGL